MIEEPDPLAGYSLTVVILKPDQCIRALKTINSKRYPMRVMVKDDGLQYVKENGPFASEVHNVQILQMPDEAAMQKRSILSPKGPQVVPVRLVGLFLVNNPEGKFMYANMELCKILEPISEVKNAD